MCDSVRIHVYIFAFMKVGIEQLFLAFLLFIYSALSISFLYRRLTDNEQQLTIFFMFYLIRFMYLSSRDPKPLPYALTTQFIFNKIDNELHTLVIFLQTEYRVFLRLKLFSSSFYT